MKRMMLPLACLLAWAAPDPAHSQAPAEQFVRGIYAAYASPDAPGSLDPRMAAQIFSPTLLNLIQRDKKVHSGEMGKLDDDPLCGCQDSDGLELSGLRIAPLSNGMLRASISLRFASTTNRLQLFLAKTPAGWRVDDVSSPGIKSLKHFLGTP